MARSNNKHIRTIAERPTTAPDSEPTYGLVRVRTIEPDPT